MIFHLETDRPYHLDVFFYMVLLCLFEKSKICSPCDSIFLSLTVFETRAKTGSPLFVGKPLTNSTKNAIRGESKIGETLPFAAMHHKKDFMVHHL